MRTCTKCGEEFVLRPGKPGLIHHCPDCASETVELLGGNMIYEHKTAPYVEVKPISRARDFAHKTKRFGAGVTCSLTCSLERSLRELRGDK